MRILMLHVDHFSSTVTQRGRSTTVEDPPSAKTTEVDEALLILTSVEKQDETNPDNVSERAVDEIAKLANKLGVEVIVLHPFAHLFAEMSRPDIALETLKLTEERLIQRGFRVLRTPFGWFNTLELKAKGHTLSRVARTVSAS